MVTLYSTYTSDHCVLVLNLLTGQLSLLLTGIRFPELPERCDNVQYAIGQPTNSLFGLLNFRQNVS